MLIQSTTNVIAFKVEYLKGSISDICKRGQSKGERQEIKKWMTDEILKLMKNTQQMLPRNGTEYRMSNKDIRNKF